MAGRSGAGSGRRAAGVVAALAAVSFAGAAWLPGCAVGQHLDTIGAPPASGAAAGASGDGDDSGAHAGAAGAPATAGGAGGAAGDDAGSVGASDGGLDEDASASDATTPEAGSTTPTLLDKALVCKLINNAFEGDPTPNQAPTRANLIAADLGIPVEANGTLYFFFGDTWGNKAIWQPGQSLPDAVGYSLDPGPALAAQPGLLCGDLRFLTLAPSQSLGPTVDPSVIADFAATAMIAPGGQSLAQYIHNPSGDSANVFPQLPGTFEVPSGAFSNAGALYLTYTTVQSPSDTTMKASYLAKWASPSTQAPPDFQILYQLDETFDASGPLYGDFVNVATEVSGSYVYFFGTGAYRQSTVHLARKALASLDTPGGVELFDASSGTWGTTRGAPVIAAPGYGETSVRWFPAIQRWMFLAEDLSSGNQIVARFADKPEGPWTNPPIVIHDMALLNASPYCCGQTCAGAQQIIHCGSAGFYGAYLLPDPELHADGSFTVLYTMSTWKPYDVVLMQATFSGA